MPKIPIVQRQISIPGTSPGAEMSVGAAGIVGEAIERAGKTQMGAIDQLSKVLERRQSEQDNIKLAGLRNEYVKWGIGYEAEQIEKKKGKDAFDVVDIAKVDLENKKQEFLKNTDSRLLPYAKNILDIENNRSLDKLTLHALREGEVAKATAKRETTELAAQSIATISDSPSEVQEEINLTTQILERLGANPYEINTATTQLVVVAVQTAINNGDIESAREHIANNKVLLDAARLRDDLNTAITAKIKSMEVGAKEQIKEERELTGNEFVKRLVTGQLKVSDIINSNLEPTGENSKQYWLEQIKRQGTASPDGFKTDKVLEAKLYQQIVNKPESIDDKEIASHVGKGLSREDASVLINERTKRMKEEGDPAREAGEQAIVQTLERDRKTGIFGEGQEGDVEHAKQLQSFRRWAKANPTKEVTEYYEKIMEPKKTTWIQKLLDYTGDPTPKAVREEIEKELKKSQQKTVTLPDGKQYKNGDIYTDPKTGKRSRVRVNE